MDLVILHLLLRHLHETDRKTEDVLERVLDQRAEPD